MKLRTRLPAIVLAGTSLLAACGGRQVPTETAAPAPAATEPAAPAAPTDQAVAAAIRAALGYDGEAYYFDAMVDLNGDGHEEVVAYVAGPMICGTGGCPVYVFTAREGRLALVGNVSVAHTPVMLAATSTNGWRDLIVHVAGGGVPSGDALLRFDGASYPTNPTVSPAEPVPTTDGTQSLIRDFTSYKDGKPLPADPSP